MPKRSLRFHLNRNKVQNKKTQAHIMCTNYPRQKHESAQTYKQLQRAIGRDFNQRKSQPTGIQTHAARKCKWAKTKLSGVTFDPKISQNNF